MAHLVLYICNQGDQAYVYLDGLSLFSCIYFTHCALGSRIVEPYQISRRKEGDW